MEILEYLESYYHYEGGRFFWKALPKYCKGNLGKEVGFIAETISGPRGRMSIREKGYQRSRLVWLFHKKEWPKNVIDHLNGVTTDDRIENLRDTTLSGNMKNRKINCNNCSGTLGVSWSTGRKKWSAVISVDRKRKFLGRFNNLEDAIAARYRAEKLHGYIAMGRK